MQLQGELQARGAYAVCVRDSILFIGEFSGESDDVSAVRCVLCLSVYKNPFHAAYTIATHEGIAALQKGLGPAIVSPMPGPPPRCRVLPFLKRELSRERPAGIPVRHELDAPGHVPDAAERRLAGG